MQIHDLHPGLKRFRQTRAAGVIQAQERGLQERMRKMFPHAANDTIRKNLYRAAMNQK